MKTRKFSIFRRISVWGFALISGLCILFMVITYFTTKDFHQASTQLLNKDVAAHIAKFTSPFESDGINKRKADSVFKDAMVISPSAEIYFLDTTGKVMAYHPNENQIQQWQLPLEKLKKLIASKGEAYITGPDPRDPSDPKIFSAAEVKLKSKKLGYIYVILGSNTTVTNVLYKHYFGSLLIKVFLVIVVLSVIFSLVYLNRIQKSFNRMIEVLERFQNGDFNARFNIKENEELAPVTGAFNKMADLLVYNIDRLTKSEKERKDFITNISHDLRTPLSIARGYTETLLIKNEKQEITPGERLEFMQLVLSKIEQVEHMVKQLFELSKMESVEFTAAKEPFIFSEILNENIHSSSAIIAEKNIALKCVHCEDTSWINADVRMMERVIQNLLINAVNYTPANGGIMISLKQQDEYLIFTIENSGEVLDKELLEWLNTSEETNPAYLRPAKSGIGLMIVKKILHLHHYSFVVQTVNGSNKFTVNMPVYNS